MAPLHVLLVRLVATCPCLVWAIRSQPASPVQPVEIGEMAAQNSGMMNWNAKYPGTEPPVLYWPLIDQKQESFAPGLAGAEAAAAASEAAASESGMPLTYAEEGPAGPYEIPSYPLPPTPQNAPPPTQPFANVDLEMSVGAAPPPDIQIYDPAPFAGSEVLKDDDVQDGSIGIPYESPPSSSEAMAGAEAAQQSGQKSVSMGVDPKVFLRRDSPNPYCDICVAHSSQAYFDGGCAILPNSQQGTCKGIENFFKSNADWMTLTTTGCVDKTGPTPIEGTAGGDPMAKCPPLLVCNILSTEEGFPLCGERIRSWGDFLPDVAKNRPVRPDMPIALQEPNRFSPPPYLGVYEGNPYCEVCATIMNSKARGDIKDPANPTTEESLNVCVALPMSLRYLCMDYVPKLMASKDLENADKCQDVTVQGQEDAKCGGLAMCNTMLSKGGHPLCGSIVGEWGKIPLESG